MLEKGYITEKTKIDFAGGECTLYENFEELLSLLLQYKIENIIIHSNAIIYSKAIENGIKSGYVSLCVSTDSAERKTHKKVKGVNTYNSVWKNIKRYNKARNKNNKNTVCVKYIIVEGINDNFSEIAKWVKRVKEYSIDIVRFNADNEIFIKYQSAQNYNHPYLANIVVLSEFFVKEARKYNLKYELDYNVQAAYKMLNVKMPEN